MADCPFPEEHQVAENASKFRKKTCDTTVRWFNNGIEGCNNSSAVAATPGADEPTCVVAAGNRTHMPDVEHATVKTSLKYSAWAHSLRDHPDHDYVSFLLKGIRNGVDIGYSGIPTPMIHNNWPSAYTHRKPVEASILRDLQKGRKRGPYSSPPHPDHYIGSPMGAFEKKTSNKKYRIIHDLSFPKDDSINEGITCDCSVHYVTIYTIVKRIQSFNTIGIQMEKIDLEDAYKHIPVRIEDHPLLGTSWNYIDQQGGVIKQYFMDIFHGHSGLTVQRNCSTNMPMDWNT